MNPNRRVTVCLFCSHPLLPSEFERILSEEEFRLLFRRVEPERASALEGMSVPRASVAVVEAHGQSEATEALAAAVLAKQPTARLLVVAEKFGEANAFPLLRIGVKGLLTYSEVEAQLSRALHVIAESGFWVPRALLSRFVDSALTSKRQPRSLPVARRLSRREKEVLDLLLQNLSNKEIAKELQISARTAKFHVSNLLAKHGVRRRADLILLTLARPET